MPSRSEGSVFRNRVSGSAGAGKLASFFLRTCFPRRVTQLTNAPPGKRMRYSSGNEREAA